MRTLFSAVIHFSVYDEALSQNFDLCIAAIPIRSFLAAISKKVPVQLAPSKLTGTPFGVLGPLLRLLVAVTLRQLVYGRCLVHPIVGDYF